MIFLSGEMNDGSEIGGRLVGPSSPKIEKLLLVSNGLLIIEKKHFGYLAVIDWQEPGQEPGVKNRVKNRVMPRR